MKDYPENPRVAMMMAAADYVECRGSAVRFGAFVRASLGAKGWTQRQLGEHCAPRISAGRISDIVRGTKKPNGTEIDSILRALGQHTRRSFAGQGRKNSGAPQDPEGDQGDPSSVLSDSEVRGKEGGR